MAGDWLRDGRASGDGGMAIVVLNGERWVYLVSRERTRAIRISNGQSATVRRGNRVRRRKGGEARRGGEEEEERGARRRDKALEADATRTAGSSALSGVRCCSSAGVDGAGAKRMKTKARRGCDGSNAMVWLGNLWSRRYHMVCALAQDGTEARAY
ncbi:hypothetical protein CFAM422_000574 [Trichoderma lentiforme]|uniref:Uncharacterized protein n=1 Tax=Trichoderma lentiforme TaxID=1567552 RepID=A0A9P4XRR9_9HYPO|nr:hypothetical protein CFAM422_000574 [Trichoderma lentiforme]